MLTIYTEISRCARLTVALQSRRVEGGGSHDICEAAANFGMRIFDLVRRQRLVGCATKRRRGERKKSQGSCCRLHRLQRNGRRGQIWHYKRQGMGRENCEGQRGCTGRGSCQV